MKKGYILQHITTGLYIKKFEVYKAEYREDDEISVERTKEKDKAIVYKTLEEAKEAQKELGDFYHDCIIKEE